MMINFLFLLARKDFLEVQTLFNVRFLNLVLLGLNIPHLSFANSADSDQLASSEANWSGSALFMIQYVNLHKNIWSK